MTTEQVVVSPATDVTRQIAATLTSGIVGMAQAMPSTPANDAARIVSLYMAVLDELVQRGQP